MALNNRDIEDRDKQQKSVNIDGEEVYNLCKVTVPGTNLYCDDNKGIPREKMPQLKSVPEPGSKADKLPKNDDGNPIISDEACRDMVCNSVWIEEYLEEIEDDRMPYFSPILVSKKHV